MTNDRVRVVIATTQGPVDVEAILDLEAGDPSIVALGSTERVISGLMASYRAFVAKGSGVIARSFGHDAFRLELSGEIHAGDSWQSAVFLAHALHKQGRLAEAGEDASTVVWATGTVDYHLRVAEIGHIPEKIAGSLERFAAEREREATVHLVWPKANAADADETLREQLDRLGLIIHEADQFSEILAALGIPWVEAAGPRLPAWEGSPYLGLAAFGQAERAIFFGRGRAREEALARLRTAAAQGVGFLLIHGGSGAGKSSLARAGLIGDITAEANEADAWRSAVLPPVQPDRPPLRALGQALAATLPELFPEDAERADRLIDLMRDNPAELIALIVEALTSSGGLRRNKIVLVVDQLEDVLLFAREGEADSKADKTLDRDRFAVMIERLAKCGAVWILTTLRSDLLSRLEESAPLSRLASDARLYRLERPNRSALRDMVLGPAQLAGLTFEGKDASGTPLPEVLVEAAARSPDSLPLLQFALDRLYELRNHKSGAITFEAYERIGGLEGAIGRHAEERTITSFGADAEMIRALEDVILALARPGDDNSTVVARTFALDSRFETARRRRVIESMAAARLVTLDETAAGGRSLRATHEALLTHWPRAERLLSDRSSALELRERLEGEARAWEARGRDPSYLLQAGRALSAAEGLVDEGRVALSARGFAYVAASSEAARTTAEAEVHRLKQVAKSERRRRQIAVGAAAGLLILVGAVAWFWRDANLERDEARRQTARAEHNLELATTTARDLIFDLAQKFSDSGLPQSVIKDILERARQLQDQLLAGGQSSAELSYGRASAIALVGQTLLHGGDLAGALTTIREAQHAYEEGAKLYPDQSRWRQGLLVTHKDLGDALRDHGEREKSLESYRQMLSIAEALVAENPNDLAWLEDLSQAHDEVGNALKDDGKLDDALQAFQAGLEVAQKLVAKDPNTPKWKMQVALADRLIGDTFNKMGRNPDALQAEQEGLKIMTALVAEDPTSSLFKGQLAELYQRVGYTENDLGHSDLALEAHQAELKIARALSATDPANIENRLGVFSSLRSVANLEWQLNNRDAAMADYKAALAFTQETVTLDVNGSRGQRDLAIIERDMGLAFLILNRLDDAESAFSESSKITEAMVLRDPNDPAWLDDDADSQTDYAALMDARGEPKKAIAFYRKALETRLSLVAQAPSNSYYKTNVLFLKQALANSLRDDGQRDLAEQTLQEGLTMARDWLIKAPNTSALVNSVVGLNYDLGSLRYDGHHYDTALAAYQDGLKYADAQTVGSPQDLDKQWRSSQFYFAIGKTLWQMNKADEAIANYRKGQEIRIALVNKDPHHADWRAGLLELDAVLGEALFRQKQNEAALQVFHDGLDVAKSLRAVANLDQDMRWRIFLATEGIAEGLGDLDKSDEALQIYQDARPQLERLVAEAPDKTDWQWTLCRLNQTIGDEFGDLSQYDRALVSYQAGLKVCQGLVAKDQSQLKFKQGAFRLAKRIGDAEARLGRKQDAIATYEDAVGLTKAFIASAIGDESWAWDVYLAERDLGDMLEALKRFDEALAADRDGLAIVLAQQVKAPQDVDWRQAHAKLSDRMGWLYLRKGDLKTAMTTFDEAVGADADLEKARWGRGLTALELGQYAAAIADINFAKQASPHYAYYELWLYIARLRGGDNDLENVKAYAGALDKSEWVAQLFRLFLLDLSPDQLIAAASATDDPKKQNEQSCEAHFYIGEFQLAKGLATEAREQFGMAAENCPTNYVEQYMAQIEFAKLGR